VGTLSGGHVTVVMALLTAIGDISRFPSSEKLVGYFGLNPSVRQSRNRPAITGISPSRAGHMPVRCLWKPPGLRRGFL
jgi:transposase